MVNGLMNNEGKHMDKLHSYIAKNIYVLRKKLNYFTNDNDLEFIDNV